MFRSPCLCREYGIVHLTHTNVNVTEREYYKFRIYFSIWFCCCQILCSQFIFGIECKNCSSVISSQFRVCFLLLKSFHFCFALKFRREMCVSCLCILYTISAFYYIRSYCIFHSIKLEFIIVKHKILWGSVSIISHQTTTSAQLFFLVFAFFLLCAFEYWKISKLEKKWNNFDYLFFFPFSLSGYVKILSFNCLSASHSVKVFFAVVVICMNWSIERKQKLVFNRKKLFFSFSWSVQLKCVWNHFKKWHFYRFVHKNWKLHSIT